MPKRRPARLCAAAAALLSMVAVTGAARPATGARSEPDACLTSGVTCQFGIPYVDDGNPAHTLDAYYPTDLTDRASVVIIHGGFWDGGTSALFTPEAIYFAQNGFAVFVINYTLSQRGVPSWPQVGTDVEEATSWVMNHADEYHGDDQRVGVLGGSSGGHLAALVDTAGPKDGVQPLATVAWSGPMDLTTTYDKGNKAAKHSVFQLLGCRPSDCPQTYADASPVTHVAPGDGSMLFFNSSDEHVPIAGAREMNRALTAAGVPHIFYVFKHSSLHARQYECAPAVIDGEDLPVIDDSLRWLGSELGQPTTPTGAFCDERLASGCHQRERPRVVPAERRFSHATTTRAAMPSSADLP
jgi:acetyl esterase/lipase